MDCLVQYSWARLSFVRGITGSVVMGMEKNWGETPGMCVTSVVYLDHLNGEVGVCQTHRSKLAAGMFECYANICCGFGCCGSMVLVYLGTHFWNLRHSLPCDSVRNECEWRIKKIFDTCLYGQHFRHKHVSNFYQCIKNPCILIAFLLASLTDFNWGSVILF